jgi:hypothetical protein
VRGGEKVKTHTTLFATLCALSCDKSVEPNFGPPPVPGSQGRILLNGQHVSYILQVQPVQIP